MCNGVCFTPSPQSHILNVGRIEKQIRGDNVSICMRVVGRVFGRLGWDVVKAMQEWMREASITLNCQAGIEERERCEKCNEMDDDGERKGGARTKQRCYDKCGCPPLRYVPKDGQ